MVLGAALQTLQGRQVAVRVGLKDLADREVVGGDVTELQRQDGTVGHQSLLDLLVRGEVAALGPDLLGDVADHCTQYPLGDRTQRDRLGAHATDAVQAAGVVLGRDRVHVERHRLLPLPPCGAPGSGATLAGCFLRLFLVRILRFLGL